MRASTQLFAALVAVQSAGPSAHLLRLSTARPMASVAGRHRPALASAISSTSHSRRASRGFATSSMRSQASDAAAGSTSAALAAASTTTTTTATALAEATPSDALASTSQFGFSFLEPWAPTLHSLADTLHITGPYAHAISIFALAFAVRTVFTLPMTLWQRRRTQRMTELVVPEWTAYKASAPTVVRARCRRAGKSYEEFQKELQADLKAKIRDLLRQHRCSPVPSFLAPLAVHLPVFLMLSALIRQSAMLPGSPFAAEVLPWWSPSPEMAAQFKASASILADRGMEPELIAKLQGTQGGPTLADRDNTMIGPVSLGMLTMTNVELTSWSRRAMAKLTALGDSTKAEAKPPGPASDAAARGQPTSSGVSSSSSEDEEPRRTRILTNAFRVLAIASIPIASQAPGALIIYWLSSGTYTLVQNSIFALVDRRREAGKLAAAKPRAAR
ncbi:uncharacterized protein PFL1_05023 [Pseudozyma flocculosa PF-1]|uniref:Related to COX18 - mitochondrial inner membrane protein required for membrane insertion of C-terminus of Cox2p n=2 Tax=Pseudozyma flocculosa TaxID=84751 RepID=A0A5C3EUT4_9BASI|nr:uncharacterized protein PFL1_05023 [Pseudozyma flocculosa PF-1]EPQ27485.1 hypothetical protein PFL1_05023 [Pseudozyma flocculosa PF-1]SPO36084.1 related to COX18 - mitochondrial inner membrane protein required for membrane insertion of C-terminus of Cox2p [Pseudozyma flocculosa]